MGWKCLRQVSAWKGCLGVLVPITYERVPETALPECPRSALPLAGSSQGQVAQRQSWVQGAVGGTVGQLHSLKFSPTKDITTRSWVCSSPKSGFTLDACSCLPTGETHLARGGVGRGAEHSLEPAPFCHSQLGIFRRLLNPPSFLV